MGEHTTARRGVLGRASSFVRGRPTTQKVGGGVAAALLASAPFGGLAAVAEPAPEPLALDQPIMVGPYKVVIDKIVEIPDLAPAIKPAAPQRLLVLDAEVTLTGDRPEYAGALTSHIRVRGGGDVKTTGRADLYSIDDATKLTAFNPGITYQVAITFTTTGRWENETAVVATERTEFRVEDKQTLDPNAWVGLGEVERESILPVVRRS